MKPGSLAVLVSQDIMPKSADQGFMFKQNPDLFYLTGIAQEETFLLLFPDAPIAKYREILWIKKTNEHIAVWEGEKLSVAQASNLSGIATVLWNDSFKSILKMLLFHAENIYLNLNEHDRNSNTVPEHQTRLVYELKQQFPLHQYYRAAPLFQKLRVIKHSIEIALIQHACYITEKAFRRILKVVKPGIYEFEIEAEITHEFICNRAEGHAYHPIIASGKDTCVLHYDKNNKVCQEGDLLLMDFGAEYAHYAADLSRTIPVSRKFSARQKAVYQAVLRVMQQSTKLLRPGNTLDDVNREAGQFMEEELIKLGLLKADEVKKQNPEQPLYKKYFMHGTSHFLGLDVHDVGNRYLPIQAGMVFTCEPGIYIPEEQIGIRLENDILVTEEQPLDLMKNIPIEIDEIEALMA